MSVFYTSYAWHGQEYWLKFNFVALKTLEERFPGVDYSRKIVDEYAEDIDLTCRVAEVLMEQGEVVRRRWGYPARRVPSSADLKELSTPADYVELAVAVVKELIHGGGRSDEQTPAEVDPWLDEFEKKKTFLASQSGPQPAGWSG